MKINSLRIILIVLLLLQMWIIFGFSNQDGETSGSISRKITEIITKNINSIQSLPKDEKEIKLKKIEHIVRKLAHFSIYTVIGFLLISLMSTYKIKQKNRITISAIIGLLYAISDEIHQAFIPGRGPLVSDVVIDFSGVIMGIFIAYIIICFCLSKLSSMLCGASILLWFVQSICLASTSGSDSALLCICPSTHRFSDV